MPEDIRASDDIRAFFSREEILDALRRGGLSELQIADFMKHLETTDSTSMFVSDAFFELLAAASADAARRVRLFRDDLNAGGR